MQLTEQAVPILQGWLAGEPVGERRSRGLLARRLLLAGMMHPLPPDDVPPLPVTVVVPAHDRVGPLARCLAGLTGRHEVIVVDDASVNPGAVEEVVRAAGAKLVRRTVNGGPAAARNTGLAHATTELVAFVDSDCVPEPGWLARLVPHFADPAVAAVAPRITAAVPGGDTLSRYEAGRSALDMGARPSIVRPGAAVSYVPGAALLVRRAAVLDGFDESMQVGEDVDLVWRLAADGHQVLYDPSVTVAHEHRTRPRPWLAQRVGYGTSAAPLAARHPGKLPAASMAGWSAAAWALAIAGKPLAGTALTAARTVVLARKLSTRSDRPWVTALQLSADSSLVAGEQLGRALTRNWWPLALPLAVGVPRLRLPLGAAAVLPAVMEYRRTRPGIPLVPWTAIRLADDVAYSVGVWKGCLSERTTAPLRPKLWWFSADGITPPAKRRG